MSVFLEVLDELKIVSYEGGNYYEFPAELPRIDAIKTYENKRIPLSRIVEVHTYHIDNFSKATLLIPRGFFSRMRSKSKGKDLNWIQIVSVLDKVENKYVYYILSPYQTI